MLTAARPEMPSNRAAAGARSMIRPRTKGPRSVIVTRTDFPLLLCVTRTLVPNGRVRCAAVRPRSVILAPLAVLVPCAVEYTDAMPLWVAAETDGSSTTPSTIIKMQSGVFKMILPLLSDADLDISNYLTRVPTRRSRSRQMLAHTNNQLCRVGKGAGTAFPRCRAYRALCPPTALKQTASPLVGKAHERLFVVSRLCQRLCPPYRFGANITPSGTRRSRAASGR
jgi:hypothetical protein